MVDKSLPQLEVELAAAKTRVSGLETELAVCKNSKTSKADRLQAQLSGAHSEIDSLGNKNAGLVAALEAARVQVLSLKEEVEILSAPPSGVATFESLRDDGRLVIKSNGTELVVNSSPNVDVTELRRGQRVLLNEAKNLIEALEFDLLGEVAVIKELLPGDRAIVTSGADQERILHLAEELQHPDLKLRSGDRLRFDPRTSVAFELLPASDVQEVYLERVPDTDYSQIGGLAKQIEAIRDAVEHPLLHPDLYELYNLRPPKGVLLYGPPGCGKTLIAKAVANSLAKRMRESSGRADIDAFFINVKGPELLTKWVGETERKIRDIFNAARDKSSAGFPVIIFFDEMDSIFQTRGSGISSDVQNTIVPQILSEIDGVEGMENVIVIGASNREDMIDPALLRPGRLDVKIKVERPDEVAAHDIFLKYLTPGLPLDKQLLASYNNDPARAVAALVDATVKEMYREGDGNKFLEVTYANGEKQVLFFKDFASGAMIENIVSRAKKFAIKRYLLTKETGITLDDLKAAVRAEFKENEDLPNTTSPDDWAKVSGLKGQRIVHVRTLFSVDSNTGGKTIIETVKNTGQYL